MIKDTEVPFEISLTGDESGEKFFGKFSALRRLSHRAQLQRSRIRREMLGAHPEHSTQRDIEASLMLSELAVSITKAPKWWAESDGGAELVDDNVIIDIFNKIQDIRKDAEKDEEKRTAESAKVLKQAVENPDKEDLASQQEE